MAAADKFENSPAGKKLMALLNDKKMAAQIGQTLAELAVALADAYAERDHWHRSFDTVLDEMQQLAGIMLMRTPDRRLVITKQELERIPRSLKLEVGAPEAGVRVYALVQREATLPGLGSPLMIQ